MLLEEGFKVTSMDASDKMLKYALKTRWQRRKEPVFDEWGKSSQCCSEGNWKFLLPPKFNVNSARKQLKSQDMPLDIKLFNLNQPQ